jgi:hypothetical protein
MQKQAIVYADGQGKQIDMDTKNIDLTPGNYLEKNIDKNT